jgi:hypothetical protein
VKIIITFSKRSQLNYSDIGMKEDEDEIGGICRVIEGEEELVEVMRKKE